MITRAVLSGSIRWLLMMSAGTCLLYAPVANSTRLLPDAAPTLEQFAAQRSTQVASGIEVGRIEAGSVRATVSAIELNHTRSEADNRSGLRIDFTSDTAIDRVYIDARELAKLRQDISRMSCSVSRKPTADLPSNHRVVGIAACRPSNAARPPICPGYYRSPTGEGLGISTRAGHFFQFPAVHPSVLVDAIDRAMHHLGVDNKVPQVDAAALPAAVLQQIVAAAVASYPLLAASPGVKTAGYSHADRTDFVTAIFRPHAYTAEYGHAMLVHCRTSGEEYAVWQCHDAEPRGYLRIPGQEREVVVIRGMNRVDALNLIDLARRTLSENPEFSDVGHWPVAYIRSPSSHDDKFVVVLRDTEAGEVVFTFRRSSSETGNGWLLEKYGAISEQSCGNAA